MRVPSEFEHFVVYSDGNDDYEYTLPRFFDVKLVDHAQLVKIRFHGKVVDKIRKVVYGEPFINCVHTNNVENFNGILRGSISCLVRRTRCIAKVLGFLEGSLHFFQFYWNFMHKLATGETPAIMEGLESKIWTWNNFLSYKIKLR